MSNDLNLKATWSHDPLAALEQDSLAYLLVDVGAGTDVASEGDSNQASTAAAQDASSGTAPLNVSLVLDTSGSMAGAKLDNLKKAVDWVIDHLSAKDTLAITLFDDEVHPLIGSQTVSDRKALHDKIAAINEAGGTAMSTGLSVGLQEAIKGRTPGCVSRIIVLTDGQTWGDADKCRDLATMAGAAGIPVTALGVGAEEDWSIELLDSMASASGGHSDYIEKPEEISPAFEKTLRAMQATTYRELKLTLTLSAGVQVRAAYRVSPVIARLWPPVDGPAGANGDGTPGRQGAQGASPLTLLLGDVEAEGKQSLLFEVVVPPRKPGQYRLARLLLQYEIATARGEAAGTGKKDAALDLTVGFAAGGALGPGEARVMNSVEKATTFKLQTRALQASMAGDVAGATRNLRAVATRLLNMGESELAEAAEKEAQSLEQEGRMSAAGTKKLTFDTRRLG